MEKENDQGSEMEESEGSDSNEAQYIRQKRATPEADDDEMESLSDELENLSDSNEGIYIKQQRLALYDSDHSAVSDYDTENSEEIARLNYEQQEEYSRMNEQIEREQEEYSRMNATGHM